MDNKPRSTEVLAQLHEQYHQAERAYLAQVETLEDEYDIRFDQIISLYGEGALDVANPRSSEVTKLIKLCETLRYTDRSKVALIELLPNPPRHSCEPSLGFRSDLKASITIITDPHSAKLRIDEQSTGAHLLLKGEGYRLHQTTGLRTVEPVMDDLQGEPQEITIVLVLGVKRPVIVDTELYGDTGYIVTGDTFSELYETFRNSYQGSYTDSGDRLLFSADPSLSRLAFGDLRRKSRQNPATGG